MCVLGSTVVVLHSPKEQEVESFEDLLEKVRDPGKTAVGSSRNSIASRPSAMLHDEPYVAYIYLHSYA